MVESNALTALLALLHPDPVEAAEAYRHLQQRLVRFFHLTAASEPQQLADETINYLAQLAAEDAAATPTGGAENPAIADGQPPITRSSRALIFDVAREVLREDLERGQPDDQEVRERFARTTNAPDPNRESRQAILRSCLSRLSPERRRLLENYYRWSPGHKAEHHSQLAQSFGLSLETLRHRVLRSRAQLESCVRRRQADTSRRSRTRKRKG